MLERRGSKRADKAEERKDGSVRRIRRRERVDARELTEKQELLNADAKLARKPAPPIDGRNVLDRERRRLIEAESSDDEGELRIGELPGRPQSRGMIQELLAGTAEEGPISVVAEGVIGRRAEEHLLVERISVR